MPNDNVSLLKFLRKPRTAKEVAAELGSSLPTAYERLYKLPTVVVVGAVRRGAYGPRSSLFQVEGSPDTEIPESPSPAERKPAVVSKAVDAAAKKIVRRVMKQAVAERDAKASKRKAAKK